MYTFGGKPAVAGYTSGVMTLTFDTPERSDCRLYSSLVVAAPLLKNFEPWTARRIIVKRTFARRRLPRWFKSR